jgi:hypothetical protein
MQDEDRSVLREVIVCMMDETLCRIRTEAFVGRF